MTVLLPSAVAGVDDSDIGSTLGFGRADTISIMSIMLGIMKGAARGG
jgi:hypothetical protein